MFVKGVKGGVNFVYWFWGYMKPFPKETICVERSGTVCPLLGEFVEW